jgi:hypothetical protein
VPVGVPSASPIDLVTLPDAGSEWSARSDGAIVLALRTSNDSSRLAIWSPATATARWLTPDDGGTFLSSPLWSADGTTVYFTGSFGRTDFGFRSIREDGTGATQLYAPDRMGQLVHLTPDGKGLVWSRGQAGGSTDVLDLASGVNRSFDGNSSSTREAWRSARPRALVVSGGCCAGIPLGELYLWDDRGGTRSAVVGRIPSQPLGALSAAWDPSGKRIAFTAIEATAGGGQRRWVVLTDETGTQKTSLPGTDDLYVLAWLKQGILVLRAPVRMPAIDLLLVQPETGATSVVYQSPGGIHVRVLPGTR